MTDTTQIIQAFLADIETVDELMTDSFIGIGYEAWLFLRKHPNFDMVVDTACKMHEYTAGDIVSKMAADLDDLSCEFKKYIEKTKKASEDADND